jgi:hypothetical protein
VAYLADMITKAPARPRSGGAMVWAYFDETVVHEQVDKNLIPTHLLVGGGVSTLEKWKALEDKWRQALSDEGVSCFHAREFYNFRKEFEWYTSEGEKDFQRHAAFRDRLADIIIEYVDEAIAFTSAVSIRQGSSPKQVEKSVYKRALRDGAFKALNALSREVLRPSGGAYVILARHPDMPPWLLLQLFADMNWDNSLKGCGVFAPEDVIQLQAADYLCNAFNRMWNELPSKSAERLQEGFRKRGKQIRLQLGTSRQTPNDFLAGVRPV